jgi:hypothetical protein
MKKTTGNPFIGFGIIGNKENATKTSIKSRFSIFKKNVFT